MIVSHFELIFKPQSPAAPTGTVAVDRVVQGYFLEITNLEAVDYRYGLEFVISPADPALPQRDLAGNALVFVDTPPGTDNQSGQLSGAPGGTLFRPSTGAVLVPAGGTALVAVLPSIFGSALDPTPITTPNFEVRGHVRITLPAIRRNVFFFQAQAAAPVRVLLTPQNRATYLLADGTISDQTQASLPLGEGQAVYAVPPEPSFFDFPFLDIETVPLSALDQLDRIEAPRGALLAALLAGIDSKADLDAYNKALAGAGIGYSVENRKRA